MILRSELLVFVIVALFFRNSCAQYPKVPCPDIFQYENSDGLNFGKLALDLGFGVTTTLELKLSQTTLSNPAVTEKIDLEIDINDVHNYMATEKAVPLKVHFQYPNVSPLVTAIRVNGATLCSGPRVPPEAAGNLTVNDSENSLSSKGEDGPMQISSASTIASTKITDEKTHLITTSTQSSSPLPQFFKHLRRRSNTPTTPTTKDSDYNDSKNMPSSLLSPTNSTTGSQSTTTLPPFLKLLRPRLNTREATTTKSTVHNDSEGSPFSDQESISVYETNPNSEQSTIATVPITTTISPQLPSFFNILRRSSIEPSSKVSSSSSTSSTILPTMSKTVTTATTLGTATTTTSFTINTLFKNLGRRSHTPTTLNAIDSTYNDSENKASPEISSTISTTAETTTSLFTTKLPRFFKVLRSQLNTPEITTIKSTILYDAQNSTFSEQESSTTLSTTTTTTVGTTLEATETSLTTNTPPITTKSSSQLPNFFKKLRRNSNTLTSTTVRMTEKLLSSELSSSTLFTTNPTISTTTRSPSELPRYLEVLYFGPNSIPADCIR